MSKSRVAGIAGETVLNQVDSKNDSENKQPFSRQPVREGGEEPLQGDPLNNHARFQRVSQTQIEAAHVTL